MTGHKPRVKNVKPVTDKSSGKTTLKPTAPKGQSVSRKIAQSKSTKTRAVSPAKARAAK